MKGIIILLCVGIIAAVSLAGTGRDSRVVLQAKFPAGATRVVAAEGDLEPRSLGSYSLRIYSGKNERFPHDDFRAGLVRSRDGALEEIRFSDLDRDRALEIVVILRCAGSGGYLSADAFRYGKGRLSHLHSVSDLAPGADPVAALAAAIAKRDKRGAAPEGRRDRR